MKGTVMEEKRLLKPGVVEKTHAGGDQRLYLYSTFTEARKARKNKVVLSCRHPIKSLEM